MIVGILSDTHGKTDMATAAVRLLTEHGAQLLIHCGDVGDIAVLDALAGHRAIFVFGNNDWDRSAMQQYAATLGIICGQECGTVKLGTKTAVVTHGDDGPLIQQILAEQTADYLFLGHTHQKMDQRQGRVRMINPGALYRAAKKTIAILDTEQDELRFLEVRN